MIGLREERRLGDASVAWEKGKEYHGCNKCLEEILDCNVHTDTRTVLCKVLLSLLFLPEWKQFPEEETWKNNLQFKKKHEYRDSVGGKKIPSEVGRSL